MADIVTVAQGITGKFTATVRDSSGNPYILYTGTETLAGTIRAGGTQAPIYSWTPTWLLASAGTISVVIPGSVTTGLEIGRYLIQLKLADGSADLYEGFLEVTYSAGTAAALTNYCGFQDLLDKAPWIEKCQKPTDLAGFARQRNQARLWFEDILHRHYRGSSGLLTDFYFVPGISFGGRFGEAIYYRDGRRSADLQGWLDANRLHVTQQVIDACAYYAIALICDRQITPGKDDAGWAQAAAKYFARAEDQLTNIQAELDTNGDGTNDTVIRLGIVDTLEG